MVVALFFVVALIYVIFKLLLPKFLKIGYGVSGVVKILVRQQLETKKNIYVIEACEKFYLIGVTEHNITNLGEVSAEYVKEKLLPKAQA
jgi:flagellar biogenesis protein FliO